MQLAINYSPQAGKLVDEGIIDVDLFKCPTASDPVVALHRPGLLDDARAIRPIYVHFPLNALDQTGVDWAEVDDVLESTETRYVNLHLIATNADFPGVDPASVDQRVLDIVADRFVEGVGQVVGRYGADRVIVENVPYAAAWKFLRACVEPEVIRRVVDETGCGLLLDLAHARITAQALGVDPIEYVGHLPVASLRELHVTGTGDGEELRDSMPMNADDWSLLEWASAQIHSGDWSRPWAAAFEYGGIGPIFDWRSDPAVIAESAPRLRSILKG